jgi:hypothetical protein
LVKKSTFGKALIVLAIVWFIYFIHIGVDSHLVFWSAFGIGMAGLLLWMYGDTGIPRPSPRVLEEMERSRRIRIFERQKKPEVRRKQEKSESEKSGNQR